MQVPRKRTIFISCQKGSVFADLVTNQIKILRPEKKTIIKKFSFDKNELFLKEMKNFLELIKTKRKCKRYLPNILEDRNTNKLAIDMKI